MRRADHVHDDLGRVDLQDAVVADANPVRALAALERDGADRTRIALQAVDDFPNLRARIFFGSARISRCASRWRTML